MHLLIGGMLGKLSGNRFGIQSLGHVEVPLVAEDADDFGGKDLVEEVEGLLAIATVNGSDGAGLHVFAGLAADVFNVAKEWALVHGAETPCKARNGACRWRAEASTPDSARGREYRDSAQSISLAYSSRTTRTSSGVLLGRRKIAR